jgi:hypothetical protein
MVKFAVQLVMSMIVNSDTNVSRCPITDAALSTKSTTLSFIYDDLRIATVVDKVFKSSMTLSTVPVSSLDRTLQIVNCYDNINFIRTIGDILTNNTDKPLSNPLFGKIINQPGYCNGSELLTVFHYLMGAYVEGCITMVIAETVKYNTTYSKIRDTCIATLNDALHMRGNLFDECRKEACTIIETNVQALAENNDTGIFGDQLKKMYPWFHFV